MKVPPSASKRLVEQLREAKSEAKRQKSATSASPGAPLLQEWEIRAAELRAAEKRAAEVWTDELRRAAEARAISADLLSEAPPDKYVCSVCCQKGHWLSRCPATYKPPASLAAAAAMAAASGMAAMDPQAYQAYPPGAWASYPPSAWGAPPPEPWVSGPPQMWAEWGAAGPQMWAAAANGVAAGSVLTEDVAAETGTTAGEAERSQWEDGAEAAGGGGEEVREAETPPPLPEEEQEGAVRPAEEGTTAE